MALAYRADIDGLRAVSILSVVAYHAFAARLPGGFAGVDVFFVISGFVITLGLLREAEANGRVDVVAFWARRARRILPAATLVLVATAAMVVLTPAMDGRLMGRHIIAAALFFYNFRMASDAVDYLGEAHGENPLLHFWSLAVEEQFYLVWPLIVGVVAIAVARRSQGPHSVRTVMIAVTITALVASLGYAIFRVDLSGELAFFDTLARAWQLLTGALLAALVSSAALVPSRSAPATLTGSLFGVVAIAALGGFFILYDPLDPYPGARAIVPVAAAAALIASGANDRVVTARLLALAPLRYIGRVSYVWYLWHWPLLVFGQLHFGTDQSTTLAIVAVSFAVAALTHQLIETPFRFSRRLQSSKVASIVLGVGLIAVGGGTGALMRYHAPDLVNIGHGRTLSREAVQRDRPVIFADLCMVRIAESNLAPCVYGAREWSRTVVLFGDSHAANWFEPLRIAAEEKGWRIVVRTKAACRPVDIMQTIVGGGRQRPYQACATWLSAALDDVENLKPDLIIVSGVGHDYPVENERRVLTRLSAVAPTVAIADTPWLPMEAADCLRERGGPEACQWPLKPLLGNRKYPRTPQRSLPPRIEVINLNDRLCPQQLCKAVQNGVVIMYDHHHLTKMFARTLAPEFRAILDRYRSRAN